MCREQEVGLIGKDRNESRLRHRVAPETLSPQQQSGKKPAMKAYEAAASGCPSYTRMLQKPQDAPSSPSMLQLPQDAPAAPGFLAAQDAPAAPGSHEDAGDPESKPCLKGPGSPSPTSSTGCSLKSVLEIFSWRHRPSLNQISWAGNLTERPGPPGIVSLQKDPYVEPWDLNSSPHA